MEIPDKKGSRIIEISYSSKCTPAVGIDISAGLLSYNGYEQSPRFGMLAIFANVFLVDEFCFTVFVGNKLHTWVRVNNSTK